MLTPSIPTMTAVRPKRSESQPAHKDALKPVRWKRAVSRAPPPVARPRSCPWRIREADRNEGVHAHIPRSSQEWNA